jgi:hypothetical protein
MFFEKARFRALEQSRQKPRVKTPRSKNCAESQKSQAGSCVFERRFETGSSEMRGTRVGATRVQTRMDCWRGMCSLRASFSARAGWLGVGPQIWGTQHSVSLPVPLHIHTVPLPCKLIEPKHHHHTLGRRLKLARCSWCPVTRKARFLVFIPTPRPALTGPTRAVQNTASQPARCNQGLARSSGLPRRFPSALPRLVQAVDLPLQIPS